MSIDKPAFLSVLSRTDGPRRETLRRELARTRTSAKGEEAPRKLVLASGSPRRLALLSQIGIEPDALRPTSIDETPERLEKPSKLAVRLARQKAEAARSLIADLPDLADAYILAADTVVAVGSRILVKPQFVEEAIASLQLLSGRSHKVFTAVHMLTPDDRVVKRAFRALEDSGFVELEPSPVTAGREETAR